MDKVTALRARQALQNHIHAHLQGLGYLQVDAPILVQAPGTEVHLDYFASEWVDHRLRPHPLYLRSSPELHLKQALSWEIPKVYHLGKCFRNGGEISAWHHPEFTMLEYYETGLSLDAFMDRTEELVRSSARALKDFGVRELPKRFERLSMAEAFQRWTGIPLMDQDPNLARKAVKKGYSSVRLEDDFETAYFKLLLDYVEPQLKTMEAVFITDYLPSQAALARVENGAARRFELYLHGIELCNAFDELLSPDENIARLSASNTARAQIGKPEIPTDEDFIAALKSGLSACCGNALGFDRLLALLLGEEGIFRLIPFRSNRPYLRSLMSENLDGYSGG